MIGDLRHKIELLSPARTGDEAGGASIVWVSGGEIWAAVERLTSTRDFAGDRDNRLKRIAVTVRPGGFELGGRLVFSGESYEIVSIESDGARRLTLICEEAA